VLLPFMALALYGVMRKIDPSYLRPVGLESDPLIAVVSTLLSGAALVGVLIPLLLKHFRLTPSCPRLSRASTSLPRLRRGWPGQARP
jgi:hypothetical protein